MPVHHIIKRTLRYSAFMNQLILAPASLLAQRIDSIIDLVVPHDIHLPSGGTFVYHYCRQAAIFWKFLIKGV